MNLWWWRKLADINAWKRRGGIVCHREKIAKWPWNVYTSSMKVGSDFEEMRRLMKTTEQHDRPTGQTVCPVVGIGASAGGLEAFRRLLSRLEASLGMAYVFVQHLDPTHQSLLTGLLSQMTVMLVPEVQDGMVV